MTPEPRTLLSVDWDYFVPRYAEANRAWQDAHQGERWLYDWGHREQSGDLFQVLLWLPRAAGFLEYDLPLPSTTGEEAGFWDRFSFAEHLTLYVADSHAAIARLADDPSLLPNLRHVWNYDAHHDAGYGKRIKPTQNPAVTCEDWVVHLAHRAPRAFFHQRYPAWASGTAEPKPQVVLDRTRRTQPDTPITDLFVCRSGSWTPPWLDEQFNAFVQAAPVAHIRYLSQDVLAPRPFDLHEAEQMAAQHRWMRANPDWAETVAKLARPAEEESR